MALCCRGLLFALVAAAFGPLASCVGTKAETHHGIVFDAGSSGSRIHIYTYRSGGDAGEFELVDDHLVKVKPGLSSFKDDPAAAAGSLRSLMDLALEKVPKSKQAETPIFLMASAGLRKIKAEQAQAILNSVRDMFENSPFRFQREWAYIMSGRDEGIFGWVTVNYLMNALNDTSRSTGVIDLGGGSVQFVYHMPQDMAALNAPEQHTGKVVHSVHEHDLYVATHSEHGLDRARDRLLEGLGKHPGDELENPCMAYGHKMDVKIPGGSTQSFIGTGSFTECAAHFRMQFDKHAHCDVAPCAFDGVFQPELPARIFGFSYLYDRTRGIGLLDGVIETLGQQELTIKEMEQAARTICSLQPSEAAARFAESEDADKWFNFCGDVTYLTVLLQDGFGIDRDTKLTMGNKLKDIEVVWTLGALIAKSGELQSLPKQPKHASEL